jgi:Uma2 family endonuclease
LTFAQFQEQYGQSDRAYEFWYGEAIPKGMPTWIHGLLQKIIMNLLEEAGFLAASEVELRIALLRAHPRPDVIATKQRPTGLYPTKGLEVVIEIVSEDDSFPHLKDKCRKYQEWGFSGIFVVDPSDRSLARWQDNTLVPVTEFAGIESSRIWQKLDQQYGPVAKEAR